MFGRLLRWFTAPAPPAADELGEALRSAVTDLEARFIGWPPDDPRWPLLCECLGLAKEAPPVRRPSDLIPFVRFELPAAAGSVAVYCDPLSRVALLTPRVRAERVVAAARVEACVRAADAESHARQAIQDILNQEARAADKQRKEAGARAEDVERAASDLAGAEGRLGDQLRAWAADLEAVAHLRQREALAAEALTRLAEVADRNQAARATALDAFAAIPTYPPSAEAAKARQEFERCATVAAASVEDTRGQAAQLDAARTDLANATLSEMNARRALSHRLKEAAAALDTAGAPVQDAAHTAVQLELESPVTATRDRLAAAARQAKLDPDRVLTAATAGLVWTAVTCAMCPDKKRLVDRLRAAVADAKAVAKRTAARCTEVDARLKNTNGGRE